MLSLMKHDSIKKLFRPILKDFNLIFSCKIPVDKHAIKKNNRPIFINKSTGKRFIGKADSLVQAEQSLILRLRQEANKLGMRSQITESVIVSFMFYFTKDDFYYKNGKEKKRDLSNLYQLPEDCLVKAGILEDDSLIANHGYSAKLPTEGDQNFLEILIFKPKYTGPEPDEGIDVTITKRATPS